MFPPLLGSSGGSPALAITSSATLPDATQNSAYSFAFTANKSAPYAWSLISGALPSGLVLDGPSGALSAAPSVAGAFSGTVRVVKDSETATQAFTLHVTPAAAPIPTPTGLTVTNLQQTSVRLDWSSTAGPSVSYEIRRKLSAGGAAVETTTTPVGVTFATIAGLTAATRYWFDVRAVSPSGASAFSAEATASTTPPPPPGEWVRLPRDAEIWVKSVRNADIWIRVPRRDS